MYDLTGFQCDLLYTIAGQDEDHTDSHSKRNSSSTTKARSTMVGSIQISIPSSIRGLVEKGEADRRTNVYTLTARGRREIEARRDWEDQLYLWFL